MEEFDLVERHDKGKELSQDPCWRLEQLGVCSVTPLSTGTPHESDSMYGHKFRHENQKLVACPQKQNCKIRTLNLSRLGNGKLHKSFPFIKSDVPLRHAINAMHIR
ncbi:hypothetical protein Fmac_032350 [Flemingia macrophylla]|uniref:Uncharacterized protein n=1 Tax=Flemingia macrophylla TaxID=520843 RepID=A0ABD1L4N2_9FABA